MSHEPQEADTQPTPMRRCLRVTLRDTGDWFDLEVPADNKFNFEVVMANIISAKYIMGPRFFIPYNDNVRHITVVEFYGTVVSTPVQREKMN